MAAEVAAKTVRVSVFRCDPTNGKPAHFQGYKVPARPDLTVLEALYHILEHLDGSIAFRSSCRAAVCGSCAMHINDQYRLACRTRVRDLQGDQVVVRPLAHLPVLKDLVVDLSPFFEHYRSIRPYLIPRDNAPAKEYLQSPAQRKKIDHLVDCILCGACYGSCPLTNTNPGYLGPHALMKTLRFVADSRDGATRERLLMVGNEQGIFRCHTIFNCQKVCPKDLDPTGAIARLKGKVVWQRVKQTLGLAR